MPRIARFRIDAIADLVRQLKFAPAKTRMRQMDAAESLAADLEPDRAYPRAFVVYRITGYRTDDRETVAFAGAALLADLGAMIQLLSDGLDLSRDSAGRNAISLDEVAQRLNVSRKTVERYRRSGLICHYIADPDGVKRLACFDDALKQFERRHADRLHRAARFSRIEEDNRAHIIQAAAKLREEEELSLNEAALRISRDIDRAHETVRLVLQRHERRSAEPIFGEHGPLTERDARLIDRALRRGVSATDLAAQFGKTAATIRRTALRFRAAQLRSFKLAFMEFPTFAMDDAERVILGAEPVRTLAAKQAMHENVFVLNKSDRKPAGINEDRVHALIAAYNFLKRRAQTGIDALPAWPGAAEIDRIETDLRWASLLLRAIIMPGLPAAVQMIEQHLGRALETQPTERIRALLALAVRTVIAVADTLDPSRRQRFDRLIAQAMDRALAPRGASGAGSGLIAAAGTGRASARHDERGITVAKLLTDLKPWEQFVMLREDFLPMMDVLETSDRELVIARFGLAGEVPHTVRELAVLHETTSTSISRRLARVDRILRDGARNG